MDPRFARNRLSAYLDGELPPGERAAVKTALDEDPGLREELERLRGVRALLREEAEELAPADFAATLRARIAEERPAGAWARLRAGLPAWMRLDAALIVTSLAGVLLLLGRATPTPPEPPSPPTLPAAPEPLLPAPPVDPDAVAPELADLDAAAFTDKPPGTAPSLAIGTGGNGGRSAAPRAPSSGPRPPGRSPGIVPAKGEEREPYTPEWERTSGTVLAGSLVDYRLASTDEKALFRLEAAVKSLGGRLLTREGKPIAPYHLDPAERRALSVELPAYKLGDLRTRLAELGALDATPRANPQLATENTPVTVTLEVLHEE
jgi:hypothetical protein